jgi:ABC-type transport system involved in multi-copper enzyme maturation permease subunit
MIDLALFRDVLRSEWTKLRSVRSTYWSIFAAVVVGIGLGAAISAGNAHSYSQMSPQDKATFDPTSLSTAGLFFAQLALGVMAIMAVTSEYSTGTIRTTLAAVPQRGYVLAAKALLVSAISLVLATAIAFAGFFVGQAIFARHHLDVSINAPGVLRAVIGGGLYIGALALFAMGIAMVLRHTAGAITALTAIVFILPGVSQLLPDSWQDNLSRYFPANAGSQITSVVQQSHTLHPWPGYLVFVAWAALMLAIGWLLLKRRDV